MMNTTQELRAACNLLCAHVMKHLPRGWEIALLMRNGDCDVTLFDPNGDEIVSEGGIVEMCEDANEMDEQYSKGESK
jgi:hypothetical protein